ncbi:MAG: nitroreductase [Deltaproteobacteria bacterium HGW-Deltaproteobacteria-19]|nr:MAG: nitroreductase [Deltaproteobacteria bacterium HGW-Deltaproteobacteria-19]
MNIRDFRNPSHPVDPLFLNRWSPRAMSGEELSEAELMTLFEAARWAPSSNNNQPWRFFYGRRNTPRWDLFFNLLTESNKLWTHRAAVLVVVASKTTFDSGKFARTHSYDAGAAWGHLALQGSLMGLVVHGMQGFDYDRAKMELAMPDFFQVEAMIAIGRPGKKEALPEHLQEREFPSSRKPLADIIVEGLWKA